jgi:UDP-N-acetylmuramoylalanine--D-glutamate ligase
MDASLFARLSPTKRIIGITGTRGKSTVTHMIAEMLHAAGMRVFLGGNVRDTATLPLLRAVTPDDTVVLELDSWQLQGFASADLSPWIAVWTNFMRDHMNYYANDMDRYFGDKAAVAMHQKPGDFFVAPLEIKERIEQLVGSLPSTWMAPRVLPPDLPLRIPGIHNRVNAGFAYAVGEILHLPDSVIRQSLADFSGLPNRLQYLGEKHQIAYYNDSNATTPEATLAALDALAGKPLVLIAGGNDKESNYAALAQAIQKAVRALVLFEGAATEKLAPLLGDFPYTLVSSMSDAVRAAETLAHPGDTILLSPGATSFGIFKNEYDRGDQFIRAFEEA